MDFSKELLEKVMKAENAEEILTLAKEEGIEITKEEAQDLFDNRENMLTLSEDDLAAVAGGMSLKKVTKQMGDKMSDMKGVYLNRTLSKGKNMEELEGVVTVAKTLGVL